MTSIAAAGIFANSSGFPIMASAKMGQRYLANYLTRPPRPATSKIDRTLDNCREVPDHFDARVTRYGPTNQVTENAGG
jgi:hypothetical protein